MKAICLFIDLYVYVCKYVYVYIHSYLPRPADDDKDDDNDKDTTTTKRFFQYEFIIRKPTFSKKNLKRKGGGKEWPQSVNKKPPVNKKK